MAPQVSPPKTRLIIVLGLLTAIGPFSIDMYLPAFGDIAGGLNTTIDRVALSLSSFFIGISAGQLVYGPLLERYGRKKPLYFGLVLYILASLGCALSPSVNGLVAFRLLQALGGCAGMVAARAMVRDFFEVKENARVFSLLMLVVAVSPILAPTLGGYITAYLGWQFVFVALMALALVILVAVYRFLPESKLPDPGVRLQPGPIIGNYAAIFRNRQFFTCALTGAIAAAGLYAYISGSPHVFMEIFKVSEQQYGWIFALVAMGLIMASQLNTMLLKNYSSDQIIKAALICQSLVGIALAGITYSGFAGLFTTIFLVFIFLGCQGFIFPNASALSMAPFAHNAGSASALLGALQMSVGALASAMVSFLQPYIPPMTGIMAFCAMLALLLFAFGRKPMLETATAEAVEEEDVEMISTL